MSAVAGLLRRLRPLDRFFLIVVVPIWGVFFASHITQWSRTGIVEPGVYVASAPECPGYPVVRSLRRSEQARASGLRAGDEILAVGERQLDCAGAVEFFVEALAAIDAEGSATLLYRRAGERRDVLLEFTPMPLPLRFVAVSGSLAVTGLLLLVRAPRSRSATATFRAFLLFSFGFLRPWGGPAEYSYALLAIVSVVAVAACPAVVRAAVVFPDDAMPRPRWASVLPWVFAPVGLIYQNAIVGVSIFDSDSNLSEPLSEALLFLLGAVLIFVFTVNYRRCDSLGRRQIRWVVTGMYLTVAPQLIAVVISISDPAYWWVSDASEIVMLLLPLAIIAAILRYNLFDIDRLITTAASYTMLSSLGVGLWFVARLLFRTLEYDLAGSGTAAGPYAAAVGIAFAVVGGNRLLHPTIERWLFPLRSARDRGVEELIASLPEAATPGGLAADAAAAIDELFRPLSCVVYVQSGGFYEMVVARGRVVPSVLEDAHPIVASMKERTEPVVAGTWSREASQGLTPFDQAVLQTLDAALLFPVVVRTRLVAFLSLGPKRSGDIYTREDLALLRLVVWRASEELMRFDESELAPAPTPSPDAYRRYVPGALAQEIESGHEIESASREVSVMFVDIRGYTSYSEGREASEIFSTVSRYTDVVSSAVIEAGGSVVEFNGDGMMAVFGAPTALGDKEAASIRAGVAILDSLAATPISGADEPPISVGIGIATGQAYVGNIQAADRMIWSAIGNTTNLASRLQDVTRTLEASVAIDSVTHQRIRSLGFPFQARPRTRIAGRSELQDVFTLPLDFRGQAVA